MSLMSSSLLLQQCSTCLVRLTLILFMMGGRCFVGCCLHFYLVTFNRIRISNLHELNKGHGSKFHVGSWVWQIPEEGKKTYQAKHSKYNNKEEDNSPKTLNDKIIKLSLKNSDNYFTKQQNEYIYIYIYIYMEVNNGVQYLKKLDNKVIQAKKEIYWETKPTL